MGNRRGLQKAHRKKNTQNDFSVATYSRRRFHVFASQTFDRVLLIYAKNFIKYPFYRMQYVVLIGDSAEIPNCTTTFCKSGLAKIKRADLWGTLLCCTRFAESFKAGPMSPVWNAFVQFNLVVLWDVLAVFGLEVWLFVCSSTLWGKDKTG